MAPKPPDAMISWAQGGERGIRQCLETGGINNEGGRDMRMRVVQGMPHQHLVDKESLAMARMHIHAICLLVVISLAE